MCLDSCTWFNPDTSSHHDKYITCAPSRNTDSGVGSNLESWIPVTLIQNPWPSFQAGSSSTPILQIRKLNTKCLTCPRWFKRYVADPQFEAQWLSWGPWSKLFGSNNSVTPPSASIVRKMNRDGWRTPSTVPGPEQLITPWTWASVITCTIFRLGGNLWVTCSEHLLRHGCEVL